MFCRAAMTIVLLGRHSLARADFTGGKRPRLLKLWQQDRPDIDDPASLVESTMALGGKIGRKVWVLDTNLWAQAVYPAVPLPASLPAADLERALGFEAEQLSGISGLDSLVGQVALPMSGSERGYWVVQARAVERDAIADVVRRAGATLAGLGHPAGLPRSVAAGGTSWQRVELWPELVAMIHGEAGRPASVALVHGDPQQGRWRTEEARWQSRVGASASREIRSVTGDLTFLDGDGQVRSQLEGKEALEVWLSAWAEQLATAPEVLPLIRPAPQPMTQRQRLAIAVMLGLMTAGVCYGHRTYLKSEREAIQAELQRVQEPGRELAGLQKQIKERETKRDQLKKETGQLQSNHDALQVQRQRLAALLRTLTEHPPKDVVIQRIDHEGTNGNPGIYGHCLHSHMADQLARSLAPALKPLGWQVQQPTSKAKNMQPDGGPWSFELRFQAIDREPPPASTITPTALQPR